MYALNEARNMGILLLQGSREDSLNCKERLCVFFHIAKVGSDVFITACLISVGKFASPKNPRGFPCTADSFMQLIPASKI